MIILGLLVALPFVGALTVYLVTSESIDRRIFLGVAVAHLILTTLVITSGDQFGEVLGIDELGKVLLGLVSIVNIPCSFAGVEYARSGRRANGNSYFLFNLLFLGTMTAALCTLHLGIFWVAIELTTLVTAPLIYNHRTRDSLEAAWKYLVLCSVGIALGLLGTLFLAIALSGGKYATPWDVLSLPDMLAAAQAGHVDKLWLRAAFVLILVGFGTKVGLAPMHSWMPDAYCEMPSPTAATSSLLGNMAFLGILRALQICDAAGEIQFAQNALIVLGLVSVGTSAIFLHGQRDFKRMLAYSSVENMGLIALGVGFGGLATQGAVLQIVNHSLVKAMLFITAGSFVQRYGTHRVALVCEARKLLPQSSMLWLVGFIAISGMPPFGIFPSKLMILMGGFAQGYRYSVIFVLLALAWIFVGMARTVLTMVFETEVTRAARAEVTQDLGALDEEHICPYDSRWYWIPAAALILLSVVMGVATPEPVRSSVKSASVMIATRELSEFPEKLAVSK
jgi:hydrogenase-4 component F